MQRDLSDIQRDFANALLDPTLVESSIAIFRGKPALNRERFQLYRGNVIGIWEQTCAAAYPVLRQLVGPEFFADLSRMYGLQWPSQSGDLHQFGAHMAEFITTLEQCKQYPYLADVARLEWQVHRSYYARLDPGANPAQLAQIAPDQYSTIRFGLQPSCAIVASEWSIGAIWSAHQTEAPVMPPHWEQPEWCLVWREAGNWAVQVCVVPPGTGAALGAIVQGCPLGDVIDIALAAAPEFNLPLALADWLQKQLIVSISTETPAS